MPTASTRPPFTLAVFSKFTVDSSFAILSNCLLFHHHTTNKMFRPQREHTEIEEELHEKAHIDYDRVAIVSYFAEDLSPVRQLIHV